MLRFLSQRTGARKLILWSFIGILVLGLAVVFAAPQKSRELLETYGPAPNDGTVVATVGKYDVTLGDLRLGIKAMGRNMQQRANPNGRDNSDVDVDALYPSYGKPALDNIINTRIVLVEADKLGIGASPDEMRDRIVSMFSQNGRWIGSDQYQRYLADQGLTVQGFEGDIANMIVQEKLRDYVTSGVTVSEQEIADDYKRTGTTMHPTFALVAPKPNPAAAPPTDDQLRAYFDAHRDDFKITKPQTKVTYLFVDQNRVGETLEISDDQLRGDYNPDAYVSSLHLARIAFNATNKEQETVAREKAQKAADAVKGDGANPGRDFAEVAKEQSEDAASKANGGDVGWLDKASLATDDPRARLFSMKDGQVSAPIKTGDGYSVFKILEHKSKSFEEAREDLVKAARSRLGYDEGVKIATEAEEKLKASKDAQATAAALNAAHNAPADKPVVVVRETPYFQTGETLPDFGANSAFGDAVAALKEVGDVGTKTSVPGGLAVPMLADKRDPHDASFDESRDKVAAAFEQDRIRNDARSLAEQLAAAATPAEMAEKAKAAGVEVKGQENYTAGGALPTLVASDLIDNTLLGLQPNQVAKTPIELPTGFVVLAQNERKEADMGDAFNKQHDSIRDRLLASRKSDLYETYMKNRLQQMKDSGEVVIYQDTITRAFALGEYEGDIDEGDENPVPQLPPVGAPNAGGAQRPQMPAGGRPPMPGAPGAPGAPKAPTGAAPAAPRPIAPGAAPGAQPPAKRP